MGRFKMIVIDTHIWIWYIDTPSVLSNKALTEIDNIKNQSQVVISCISTWELYMLEKKKRLKLKIPAELWVKKCERLSFFNFLPVTNDIANIAVNLPDSLHQDPADRLIIATAKYLGVPLITKDKQIQDYKGIKTIW